MQRDAFAATLNPCCKQNFSARVQMDMSQFEKHELHGLDTN